MRVWEVCGSRQGKDRNRCKSTIHYFKQGNHRENEGVIQRRDDRARLRNRRLAATVNLKNKSKRGEMVFMCVHA